MGVVIRIDYKEQIMIPSYFEFYNPVKILSGNKAVDNLPYELDGLGAKRPLIITDKGVEKAGLMKVVINAFKDSKIKIGTIYRDTPQDSSISVVNEVASIYRKAKCDSIVAVGGGSVIDTAKGVNIVITEGTNDLIKYIGAETLRKPMEPLIVVPTTAGTGSEVTMAAVIANPEKDVKMAFTSYFLFPKIAILDPRMTLTMPPRITAATGMDSLTHAVEAYSCIQKNPLSDVFAVSSIGLIAGFLVKAVKNKRDKEARFAMANASLMAGAAFSNSMVGAVHSLAHACGGVCHIPHGIANSILLPFVMEYNLKRVARYYAELLLPLVGPDEYVKTDEASRATRTIAVIRELTHMLNGLCGLPLTLKEAGVPEDKLSQIAESAINDGSLTFNPEEVDYDDALAILRSAY